MEVIKFIIANWFELIIAIVAIGAGITLAVKFFKQPSAEQLKKVKEWLLWAVLQAEADLGSGTGAMKLAKVYDMFVARFPAFALIISFAMFEKLVNEALDTMRELLASNPKVADLVISE